MASPEFSNKALAHSLSPPSPAMGSWVVAVRGRPVRGANASVDLHCDAITAPTTHPYPMFFEKELILPGFVEL